MSDVWPVTAERARRAAWVLLPTARRKFAERTKLRTAKVPVGWPAPEHELRRLHDNARYRLYSALWRAAVGSAGPIIFHRDHPLSKDVREAAQRRRGLPVSAYEARRYRLAVKFKATREIGRHRQVTIPLTARLKGPGGCPESRLAHLAWIMDNEYIGEDPFRWAILPEKRSKVRLTRNQLRWVRMGLELAFWSQPRCRLSVAGPRTQVIGPRGSTAISDAVATLVRGRRGPYQTIAMFARHGWRTSQTRWYGPGRQDLAAPSTKEVT